MNSIVIMCIGDGFHSHINDKKDEHVKCELLTLRMCLLGHQKQNQEQTPSKKFAKDVILVINQYIFLFVFKLIYIFKLALTLHNFRMQVHCRSDLASHKNANIGAVRILRERCSLEVAIGKSQPKSRRLPKNRLLKKTLEKCPKRFINFKLLFQYSILSILSFG